MGDVRKFIGERKKLVLAGMKGRSYTSSLAIEKKGLATNYRVSFHVRENPSSLRNFFCILIEQLFVQSSASDKL